MRIKRYVPAFIDIEDEPDGNEREFNTLEELLEIPFVKRKIFDGFKRFSISYDSDKDSGCYLMAEYNDGSDWVAGFIYGCDTKNPILPRWEKDL